jgi:DNA-binding NarL/FixJ family response regulator
MLSVRDCASLQDKTPGTIYSAIRRKHIPVGQKTIRSVHGKSKSILLIDSSTVKDDNRKKKISRTTIKEICNMKNQGLSIKNIAQKMSLTKDTIQKALLYSGIMFSNNARKVSELLHKGFTKGEIQKKLNISRQRLYGYIPFTNDQII